MTADELRDILYLANDVLQLRNQYDGYLDEIDKIKLTDIYRKIISEIPEDFKIEKSIHEDPFNLRNNVDTNTDDNTQDFDF